MLAECLQQQTHCFALNISEGTVKVHLKSLMKKISAGNRTQADASKNRVVTLI
jgi:DNA-binding NarL/FixJ family response regulator